MNPIEQCPCRRCEYMRRTQAEGWGRYIMTMILCPICGNKRCPHASDHRYSCTGSNEPGQFGSDYGTTEAEQSGPQARHWREAISHYCFGLHETDPPLDLIEQRARELAEKEGKNG